MEHILPSSMAHTSTIHGRRFFARDNKTQNTRGGRDGGGAGSCRVVGLDLDLLIDLSRDGEDEALDVARHVAQAHMDLRTQRGGFRIRGKLRSIM